MSAACHFFPLKYSLRKWFSSSSDLIDHVSLLQVSRLLVFVIEADQEDLAIAERCGQLQVEEADRRAPGNPVGCVSGEFRAERRVQKDVAGSSPDQMREPHRKHLHDSAQVRQIAARLPQHELVHDRQVAGPHEELLIIVGEIGNDQVAAGELPSIDLGQARAVAYDDTNVLGAALCAGVEEAP